MNPDIITSKDNPRIKALAKLYDHPSRDGFIIEGFHSVEVAYSCGALKEVYALKDPQLKGVKCTLVNETILKKLSKAVTFEKIIGLCELPKYEGFAGDILILDRIQDPGNVGTLLRTAASFGFEDVIFLKGCCSPFNAKVIASSEGSLFHIRLHYAEEAGLVEMLHKEGYTVLGSALEHAEAMETYHRPDHKIALILGNEGQGMSKTLLEQTDANLRISIRKMESLNVGVAGGILMHYLAK